MWCYWTRTRHRLLKGKRTRSPKAIDGGVELEAALASDTSPLIAVQTGRRRNIFPTHASESTRAAGDEAAAVAGRWPLGVKGRTRAVHGQPVATQTAPKFGPRLRPRGQADKNVSGHWEHFFPSPVKIGPN
jgi:hypothetical protein